MTFANPGYLFLLLLLVPVVGWYIWKLHNTRAAVQLSSTENLSHQPKSIRVWLIHVPFVLRVAAITLLALALAHPQLSNRWQSESTEGIDIMMALDISGTMLGGGSAEWSGTVDGIPVVVAKDEEVASTYLMGLISNPLASDIKTAQEYARVYVNGNDSYTHGGGILCNGYMLIGAFEEVEVYSRLEVFGRKELITDRGEEQQLTAGQFEFEIVSEDTTSKLAVSAIKGICDGLYEVYGDAAYSEIPFLILGQLFS